MGLEVITGPICESIGPYQVLWGALVGFGGVIITLVVNSNNQMKLQAGQKKHDMELQTHQKAHEANTLRVALKAELVSVKESYEENITPVTEGVSFDYALYPNSAFHVVFDSHLEKLGLLSREEIAKVIKAYRLISELPYRLRQIVGVENVAGYEDEYIIVPANKEEDAKKAQQDILEEIEGAIREIDLRLSDPD
ncbi:MAG: hypothetical protein AB2687_01900 [Candidatus Thiodiazotropha taylori]